MNRLPPLKALQAFRYAAEQGSFKHAAEQLFVTQAAISQQIKTLEQHLGLTLFKRMTREVELTSEGRLLLPFVSKAFGSLEEGISRLEADPYPNRLTLSTLPSFASRWLVPRLGRFQDQADNMTIHLSPGLKLDSFENNDLDLAIRYGLGNYPGLSSRLLLKDFLLPVCHPSLIDNSAPVKEQLQRLPLLIDDAPDMAQLWPEYEQALGVSPDSQNSRLQVTDSTILVEALISAQGLSVLRYSLVYELLERGILICPVPLFHPTAYDFFLVAPEHHFQRAKVQQFCHWIEQEVRIIKTSGQAFRQAATTGLYTPDD